MNEAREETHNDSSIINDHALAMDVDEFGDVTAQTPAI